MYRFGKICNPKLAKARDPLYECNSSTGRWVKKKTARKPKPKRKIPSFKRRKRSMPKKSVPKKTSPSVHQKLMTIKELASSNGLDGNNIMYYIDKKADYNGKNVTLDAFKKILNLSPYSSESDVKKAYRRAVIKFHPDRYRGDHPKLAGEILRILNSANQSNLRFGRRRSIRRRKSRSMKRRKFGRKSRSMRRKKSRSMRRRRRSRR